IVPFIALALIFSFALACNGCEPSTKEISKPGEEGVAEVKEIEKVEEAKTKEVSEIKGKKIIGYRDTELRDKVPVVEWEIGKPIDYPNGLRLILNEVWEEKQESYPFVVINETLINTTKRVQDGYYLEAPVCVWVWDSQDNKFFGNGGLTNDVSVLIWDKIDKLSPGVNKKWPRGKKLTGNIYFDVSGNTGSLMVELEYCRVIRPSVIYRYCLEE
ncbi:unnamed protein product, partial [marine sediment metagenome]